MASNDNNSYRPEPTRLVLLNEVAQQEAGTKIRFLGCVHEYNVPAGMLMLRDDFPVVTNTGSTIMAKVDNEMLSLNTELLETGAWINIIGYVRKTVKVRVPTRDLSGRRASKTAIKLPVVDVTLVWSAGAIQHDKYQAAVKSYRGTT